ncbi:hypothetical protein [Bacillus alveayuensis]|uniref:hypothetical protein n=1 Tax=Aeribacillus alveayuensis TaxID=279215 RepID=UPI0013648B16|nr:hypothetical protein [Bacillus alveayuensis]
MPIKLYCDVDEQGNIITVLAGETILPDREYDYFFTLESWDEVENISLYKVENDQLVFK